MTAHTLPAPALPRRRTALRTAAVGFSLAWLAGLAVPVPLLDVDAPAPTVLAAVADHAGDIAVRSLFVHAFAAVALLIVAFGLRSRAARVAGLAAAGLSVTQFLLELALAGGGGAGLMEAVNRLDGVKMLALAALALAGSAAGVLPRWLRMLGPVLAVALVASAAGYGLLLPALAPAAYVSLPLLLVWITGSGLALARSR